MAAEESENTKKSLLPVFTLRGGLSETPQGENPFGGGTTTALKDLIARLDKAAKDKSVPGIVLVIDGIRYDEAKGAMMAFSFLIPLIYLAFFLFAPAFTNLNQSRPVPERVTG